VGQFVDSDAVPDSDGTDVLTGETGDGQPMRWLDDDGGAPLRE
jgi:hypothetical protein